MGNGAVAGGGGAGAAAAGGGAGGPQRTGAASPIARAQIRCRLRAKAAGRRWGRRRLSRCRGRLGARRRRATESISGRRHRLHILAGFGRRCTGWSSAASPAGRFVLRRRWRSHRRRGSSSADRRAAAQPGATWYCAPLPGCVLRGFLCLRALLRWLSALPPGPLRAVPQPLPSLLRPAPSCASLAVLGCRRSRATHRLRVRGPSHLVVGDGKALARCGDVWLARRFLANGQRALQQRLGLGIFILRFVETGERIERLGNGGTVGALLLGQCQRPLGERHRLGILACGLELRDLAIERGVGFQPSPADAAPSCARHFQLRRSFATAASAPARRQRRA